MSTNPPVEGRQFNNTIKFLHDEIQEQIDYFEAKRRENRSWAISLRWLAIISGSIVTVLVGLQLLADDTESLQAALTVAALILSAFVTITNAVGQDFGYGQIWILYTMTVNSLYGLKSELQYMEKKLEDGAPIENLEQQFDKIYKEYSAILENANEVWEQLRQQRLAAPDIDKRG